MVSIFYSIHSRNSSSLHCVISPLVPSSPVNISERVRNGEGVDVGEVVDLFANSDDTLVIQVFDANMCEVYFDTLFYSCSCERNPGEMSGDTVTACFDEEVVVDEAFGIMVSNEDSLIYILHDFDGGQINNILLIMKGYIRAY